MTRRRRLWWPFRHRPHAEATVVIRHAGPLPRMTLREHVVVRHRVWKGQRDIRRMRRESELPRFYKRAAGRDVDGLTINGASWTVGDFLPVGFDAYVRLPNPFWKIVAVGTEGAILHPRYDSEDEEAVWAKPLHCAEVATANGLRMAHDTSWGAICDPRERARGSSPDALCGAGLRSSATSIRPSPSGCSGSLPRKRGRGTGACAGSGRAEAITGTPTCDSSPAAGATSFGAPGSETSPGGSPDRIRVSGTITCRTSSGPVTGGGVWRCCTAATRAIWAAPAP